MSVLPQITYGNHGFDFSPISIVTDYPFIKLPHCQCQVLNFFWSVPLKLPVHKI
jgi:hypothetical protein